MEAPKTWLSAIVRPDAVYIQAYIFSAGYGYISNKSLTLRNITTNEVIQYQLLEEANGTCLFKNNQKINPAVNSSFVLQLSINLFSYETNSIEVFNNVVEIKTPIAWSSLPTTLFDINISNEVVSGKTTIEPKITVIINGGIIPNNSILKICGSNAFADTISYNSYDAAKEFILDGTQYVFSNTFKLGVSGLWNFKAFLKLPNNTITGSIIISHVVNQGDIYVNEIVETDNLVKLETSERFNLNQLVGGKRVGICTVNDAQTLQKGSFYEFHNNSGQWYFDVKESLKTTIYRLPTIAELEAYAAIKSTLIGSKPIVYFSSEETEAGSNSIKAWNFNNGAPTTAYAGDSNVGYLILEDFENNISTAEPLIVPVFRSNLMIQPSGYKITDFAKSVDLYNYMSVDMLINSINLLSITTAPEGVYGGKYYDSTTKKIYTALDVTPGLLEWVKPQNPSIGVTYNFNGISYLWDGIDLRKISINSGISDNFEVVPANSTSTIILGKVNRIILQLLNLDETIIYDHKEVFTYSPSSYVYLNKIDIDNAVTKMVSIAVEISKDSEGIFSAMIDEKAYNTMEAPDFSTFKIRIIAK